jgi:hypothetical protein
LRCGGCLFAALAPRLESLDHPSANLNRSGYGDRADCLRAAFANPARLVSLV